MSNPEILSNISFIQSLAREGSHLSSTYSIENSGYFADIMHSRVEPHRLQGNEIFASDTISKLLEKQETLTVVDIGGMLGTSFVRIANQFPQEIDSGRLHMIVTNLEPDFTIEKGIAEAKRRYLVQTHWGDIVALWQSSQIPGFSMEFLMKQKNKLLLETPEEIEFLEQNNHRVSYRSGVDTLDLPSVVSEPVDIVHERLGGFHHHKTKWGIMQAVGQIIRPQTGIIMTTTELRYLPDYYGMRKKGLTFLTQLPAIYHVYGMPEAPISN